MKTYYFPNDGHADAIYGSQYPVCLDEAEVKRLSREWGEDLFEVMHEATPDEIAEYGVYNSDDE